MKKYSFKLVFKKYLRKSPSLQDVRSIYVSDICIVAKNSKHGGFYFSKYVSKITGKFHYAAGSVRYPILFPIKDKVVIQVEGFPKKPILEEFNEWKDFIFIEDISENLLEII